MSAPTDAGLAVARPTSLARPARGAGLVSLALWALRRRTALVLGVALVALWLALAIAGPLLVRGDPNEQDLSTALVPPAWEPEGSREHLLGTDHLGRDILVRIVYGARTSLVLGASAVALAAVLGSLAGVVAGDWGGRFDDVLMRLADVQLSIPFILLAIGVLGVLGGSTVNMIAVLVVSGWVIYARVVRSEVLQLREMEFMVAARALGAGRLRRSLRHLLPNTLGLVIVVATFELANVIVLESALSFLGVGIRPPDVSWGAMLADGREYLTTAWWLATLPGVAITATILGVNLTGDWMRDALDPRLRNR